MKNRDFQDILKHAYAAFVVLVTFWIYMKTLAPTVSFFDSGELISAAHTLGVAHPPGYPLYVLLGWLFSRLPIGTVAYRLNLMSAFFASLAALVTYYITYIIVSHGNRKAKGERRKAKGGRQKADGEIRNPKSEIRNPKSEIRNSQRPDPDRMLHPVASMIAALTFAFSMTHWQHALIAEVYSLNAFLCGLIVLLLVKWHYDNAPQKTPGVSENSGSLASSSQVGKTEQNSDTPNETPEVSENSGSLASPPLVGGVGGGVGGGGQHTSPRHAWLLYLTALVFGLGFGNHQTIVLLSFAACFLVLVTAPRIILRLRTLAMILLFLVLGLSIYVLVPIRAAQNPPINWGNPITWKQFKWLVTREGYSNVLRGDGLQKLWSDLLGKDSSRTGGEDDTPLRPPQGGNDTPLRPPQGENDTPLRPPQGGNAPKGIARLYHSIQTSLFLKQLLSFNPLKEFGYLGMTLAILGIVYSLFIDRVTGVTMLIALVSLVVITVIIGDPPEENIFLVKEFHTPSYLLVAIWLGIGAMALARAALWVVSISRNLQYMVVFVLAIYFLTPPGVQMWENLKKVDRQYNYVAYDYASNILNSLQSNAILFTWGDSGAFPLWYLQIVEGKRPDVTLIHVPHLGADWFVELLPPELFISPDPFHKYAGDIFPIVDEIVQKNGHSRPIYFDFSSAHSIVPPYQLLPHGIVYKVEVPGDELDETVWDRYSFRGILDNTRIRIAKDPDVERTFTMYGSARMELGNYYLDQDQVEKAAKEFNAAVQFDESLGDGIVRMLQFRDKMLGGHVPVAPHGMQNNTVVPPSEPE